MRVPALTAAVGALRPFALAESYRRAGRASDAADTYAQAVALDSTFAWAYYRLSTALEWLGLADSARASSDRALAMSQRLSGLEQRQLDAWRSYLWGDVVRANSAYEALVRELPGDPELWSRLAELRFHWGPLLGVPRVRADSAFRQVLAFTPEDAGALLHRLRYVGLSGDVAEVRRVAAAFKAGSPDEVERLEADAIVALLEEDPSALATVAPRIATLDPIREGALLASLATSAPDPMLVRELVGRLPAASGEPDRRIQRRILRAQLAAAAGRFRDAYADLDSLAAFLPERALEYRAFLALAHPAGIDPATARALRDSLAALPPPPVPIGARVDWGAHRGVYPPRRILLEALLGQAAGEAVDSILLIRRLDSHGDLFASRYVYDMRILARAGRTESQLGLLGDGAPEPDNVFPDRLSYVEAWRRWTRVRLLLRLGRVESALAWLATFPDPAAYDLPHLPAVHLLMAETLERQGRRDAALAHYRRALALWSHADPEIQPFVDRARSGVKRLGG